MKMGYVPLARISWLYFVARSMELRAVFMPPCT